jgi:hypothetical protein
MVADSSLQEGDDDVDDDDDDDDNDDDDDLWKESTMFDNQR